MSMRQSKKAVTDTQGGMARPDDNIWALEKHKYGPTEGVKRKTSKQSV